MSEQNETGRNGHQQISSAVLPQGHGQFRSVFSVKLFVELSRPRPDFVDVLAPSDASSAALDWIKAELSRADRWPGMLSFTVTGD
jgi:hypothetical protein